MIMADVFTTLFLVLGSLITIVCYWLFFEGVTPQIVDRARMLYAARDWRTFLVGLLIGLPGTLFAIALLQGGAPARFLGFALLFSLILTGLMGSAGFAKHIGSRLGSESDSAHPWKRVLRGGVVLSITFVLPGVGWFLVLPFTLLSGLGASATSLWRPRVSPEQAPDLPHGSAVQA